MSSISLEDFVLDLQHEIDERASSQTEGTPGFQEEEFTGWCLEQLSDPEIGVLTEGQLAHHAGPSFKANGYSLEDGTLNLFTTLYTRNRPGEKTGKDEVERAFRRLEQFFTRSLNGLHEHLEESSPGHDMALRIMESREEIQDVRFFLFTDSITTIKSKDNVRVENFPCTYQIWDLERLYRAYTSGKLSDSIEVDLSKYSDVVPCLRVPDSMARREGGYEACLAIFPGQVLASIYRDHGAQLLERNVRAFLQVTGKVNKGIRETITSKPLHFLAYNNGISATASSIEYVQMADGTKVISRLVNLQIVNGGQTTASLFHALQDKVPLEGVYVQAKISIIEEERLDEMVPLISRYANSQNKVNDADFAANDPYHIGVEKLSRSIWAPTGGYSGPETRWFYERARGQYADAKNRAKRISGMGGVRKFEAEFPLGQKFTKTDLAKYVNTWDQLPHIVSLGSQKNFNHFTASISKGAPIVVDSRYFHQLIAKAILFREAEKIVQAQKFGGFRANIVSYTLALISHLTDQRVDLEEIWRRQKLSTALRSLIASLCHQVHQVIMDPKIGTNIGEWCKKPRCWELVQAIPFTLGPEILQELTSPPVSKRALSMREAQQYLEEFLQVPGETWTSMSRWLKTTDRMDPIHRTFVDRMSRQSTRKNITGHEAEKALRLLDEAKNCGFPA